MLMRLMRQKFHFWVFVLLAIVMAIGLVMPGYQSASHQDAIVVVNGESIKYDHFASMIRNVEEGERARSSRELTDSDLNRIRHDTLDTMVNEALALQGLEKLGLHMDEEEVRQTLLSVPTFKDAQGNFSQAKYTEFLQRQMQQGQSVADTEAMITKSLRLSKAQTFWTNAARVTPMELDLGLKKLGRRAKTRVLAWDYSAMQKGVKAAEDDLHSYYSLNRSRWVTKEQARASHILIKADVLGGTLAAKAKADALYERAKKGESFAKLAKENSQDEGSAAKGGDLGTFSKGDMVPAFEQKAFSMKPGQVGEPVLSQFGWHIIRLESKKAGFEPTFENSKSKVIEGYTLDEAKKIARSEASAAEKALAEGKSLEEAAKGGRAVLKQSGWFKTGDKALLTGLGDTSTLADELLALDMGAHTPGAAYLEKGAALGVLTEEQAGELPKDAKKLQSLRATVLGRLHSEKASALYDGWLKSLKAEAKIDDRFQKFYGGLQK